jgi:hypothetical protein
VEKPLFERIIDKGICYDSLVVHNENNGLIFFGHGIFTEPQVEGSETIAAIF